MDVIQCDVCNLIFILCFNINDVGSRLTFACDRDLIVSFRLSAVVRITVFVLVVHSAAVVVIMGHLRDVVIVVLDINVHIAILQIIGARKGRDRAGCDHRQERCRGEDTEHRPVGLAVLCLHKKYPLFLLIPKFLFSKEALRLTTATCKKSLSDTDYNLQKSRRSSVRETFLTQKTAEFGTLHKKLPPNLAGFKLAFETFST